MGFTNTTISGLRAWYDAALGVTQSGGLVSAWADQSGNGNDVVASAAPQPGFTASVINGLPGLYFNGSGQQLVNTTTNLVPDNGNRTIIAVIKCGSEWASGTVFDFRNSGNDFALIMGIGGAQYVWSNASGVSLATAPPTIANVPMVAEMFYDNAGPTLSLNLNTVSQALSTTSPGGDNGLPGFQVGNRLGIANQPFAGDICEILVFDHVLSGGDRQQVNAYLQDKYAISLGITPTSISPTTATVAPGGNQTFTGADGSGTGYTYAITVNNSGGSINSSSGVYTAGTTGSVTDTVEVTDSVGGVADAVITVTGGAALSITPTSVTLNPGDTQTFTGAGGTAPYTYSISVNNSGGSINASTGDYVAGTTGSVTDTVTVTDAVMATADATVTVTAGVTLSPGSVTKAPGGTQTFTASGGSGTGFVYSFSFNGSGGSINASTGAYIAGNVASNDQIVATDSLGNVSADSTVTIPGVVVSPSSASLAPLQSANFSAMGGSGTGYTWAIPVNNSGASINSSGHYVAGATGSVSDLVQATDSLGNTSTGVVVTVGAVLAISPSTATVGPRVGFTFTASGGSGVGTTFSFVHNNSGGTLNSSTGGYVAGTTGSRVDTVRVVDNSGAHADAVVTVGPNLTIAPANSTINKGSARTFTHGGGSGSGITFSLTQNQSGATLNSSTGAYTAGFGGGIPAVDIILVSDDVGNTASATVSAYPPNFYVQGVTLIGLSTLRVKFSYPPKAVDPTATNDALHPANYVLVGNDITYVITCIPVVGDESSIDCLMAAPFGFGKWTLSVSNIQSADGGQTL